jgi:hypothetical protein
MANFAELNEENKVIRVIVVNNEVILENGIESEQKGIEFCKSLYGQNTKWIQTSFSGKFRKKMAGIGDFYSEVDDGFIPMPDPIFASWIFDKNLWTYVPPIPCPQDGPSYEWSEITQSWVKCSYQTNPLYK